MAEDGSPGRRRVPSPDARVTPGGTNAGDEKAFPPSTRLVGRVCRWKPDASRGGEGVAVVEVGENDEAEFYIHAPPQCELGDCIEFKAKHSVNKWRSNEAAKIEDPDTRAELCGILQTALDEAEPLWSDLWENACNGKQLPPKAYPRRVGNFFRDHGEELIGFRLLPDAATLKEKLLAAGRAPLERFFLESAPSEMLGKPDGRPKISRVTGHVSLDEDSKVVGGVQVAEVLAHLQAEHALGVAVPGAGVPTNVHVACAQGVFDFDLDALGEIGEELVGILLASGALQNSQLAVKGLETFEQLCKRPILASLLGPVKTWTAVRNYRGKTDHPGPSDDAEGAEAYYARRSFLEGGDDFGKGKGKDRFGDKGKGKGKDRWRSRSRERFGKGKFGGGRWSPPRKGRSPMRGKGKSPPRGKGRSPPRGKGRSPPRGKGRSPPRGKGRSRSPMRKGRSPPRKGPPRGKDRSPPRKGRSPPRKGSPPRRRDSRRDFRDKGGYGPAWDGKGKGPKGRRNSRSRSPRKGKGKGRSRSPMRKGRSPPRDYYASGPPRGRSPPRDRPPPEADWAYQAPTWSVYGGSDEPPRARSPPRGPAYEQGPPRSDYYREPPRYDDRHHEDWSLRDDPPRRRQ